MSLSRKANKVEAQICLGMSVNTATQLELSHPRGPHRLHSRRISKAWAVVDSCPASVQRLTITVMASAVRATGLQIRPAAVARLVQRRFASLAGMLSAARENEAAREHFERAAD